MRTSRSSASRLAGSRGNCLDRILTATCLPLRTSSARQTAEVPTRSIRRYVSSVLPGVKGSTEDMAELYWWSLVMQVTAALFDILMRGHYVLMSHENHRTTRSASVGGSQENSRGNRQDVDLRDRRRSARVVQS